MLHKASSHIDMRLSAGRAGAKVSLTCSNLSGRVGLTHLLPALHSMTDDLVEMAAERQEEHGRPVSCKSGCGACCRRLVPLSRTEVRELLSVLADLDEDHRGRVLARFEDSVARLQRTSLWERLAAYSTLGGEERARLAADYFHLRIACPFLENSRCSIHASRPLMCRQHMVTSPPDQCAEGDPALVETVALAADVLAVLFALEANEDHADERHPLAYPLVLAPLVDLPEDLEPQRVSDWLKRLLAQIGTLRPAA